MQNYNYTFSEFGFSSKIIQDLTQNNPKTAPFVGPRFTLYNCISQIKQKKYSKQERELLVLSLNRQNKNINLSELSKTNIELLLKDNSYTITTGHQLNFMTGPLYSLYKILQVISWSEKLKKHSPNYNFIPLFWMATEDHDFEEINHIDLFNSKIELENENQNSFIAGAITATNYESIKETILQKFSDPELKPKIETYLAYYKNNNLATASKLLINDLFGKYGLVIIDGNDKLLKQSFAKIVKQELESSITYKIVSKTNIALEESGYHQQVHVRLCNLFYIENKITRHRISKTGNAFEINGKTYTLSELLNILENYPERFSPNALLRPVYQELILPNLMYLGGGGEIAYWMQLKDLFNTLGVTFPIIKVRDSYLLINDSTQKLMQTFNLTPLDLKTEYDNLAKNYVTKHASDTLNLTQVYSLYEQLKLELQQKTSTNDIGISRFIEGELVKIKSQLEKIEKKLTQHEKKQHDKALNQLKKLRFKIYPDGGFQERYENLLQYINFPNFIDILKTEIDTKMTEVSKIISTNI